MQVITEMHSRHIPPINIRWDDNGDGGLSLKTAPKTPLDVGGEFSSIFQCRHCELGLSRFFCLPRLQTEVVFIPCVHCRRKKGGPCLG